MKTLLALTLSLATVSCAQTTLSRDDTIDRAGAGSSAPGGRADGQPGSYGPAAPAKDDKRY